MATLPDTVTLEDARGGLSSRRDLKVTSATPPVLPAWLRAQSISVHRHGRPSTISPARIRLGLSSALRRPYSSGQQADLRPQAWPVEDVEKCHARHRQGPSADALIPPATCGGAQGSGSQVGAGYREDLGLLFRALWPAPVHAVWRMAAELRPHRYGLLSGCLHRYWCGEIHTRSPALLLHAHRLRSRHHTAWHSGAKVGQAAQSISACAVALSPPGKPVDAGRRNARGQP